MTWKKLTTLLCCVLILKGSSSSYSTSWINGREHPVRSLERAKSHEETCDADGLKPKEQQQRGFHLCLLLLLSCSWSWEFQSNWEPSWGLLFSRALSNAEEALFHSVWNSGLKCAYFLKEFHIILSYPVHFIFYTLLFSPFFLKEKITAFHEAHIRIYWKQCTRMNWRGRPAGRRSWPFV